jgi:nucleotide-binding universal stress UspA family protein
MPYVINVTDYDSILLDESWAIEECEECEEKSHKATSSVKEKAKFAGLEAESIILKGNPAEKILDFANEHDVDMIVFARLEKAELSVSRLEVYPKKL